MASRSLSMWKATRGGVGLCVNGIDNSTGGHVRISDLQTIEATDGGIIATDKDGNRHRLSI